MARTHSIRCGATSTSHDAFSCRAVTKAVLERYMLNREWRWLGWLVRNLAIKLAMKHGNRAVPRLLGHRESCFPY